MTQAKHDQSSVLFAAIIPPPDAVKAICAIQEKLKQQVKGKLTWVAPSRMHVTVFFFGGIYDKFTEAGQLDHVGKIVDWAFSGVRPVAFEVRLHEVAMKRHRFGDGHRSLFLSGADCKPLVELARRINADMNKPPHLTLARFREPVELPPIEMAPVNFMAQRITLIRSIRLGADFGYQTIKEWALPAE